MFAFSIFWTYLWFAQFMLQWYGNIPEDTNYWVKRFDTPVFKWSIFLSLILNFAFPLLVILTRGSKRNFKIIGTAAVVVIFGHYLDFFNMIAYEPNAVEKEHEVKAEHHASNTTADYTLLAEAQEVKTEQTETVAATDVKAEEVHTVEAKVAETHEAKEAGNGEEHESEDVKSYAGVGLLELAILAGFLGIFLFLFFIRLSKEPLINPNDPYLGESLRHHVEYA
jgi:hypothetical protein